MFTRSIIASLIGATLYRLRGGLWRDMTGPQRWFNGTQAMRALWAIPTAAFMAEMSHGPLWALPTLAITNFAGLAMFGNGQYLTDHAPVAPDPVGWGRNTIAASPMLLYDPLVFVAYSASGGLHAVLYWLGFRMGGRSQLGECFVGGLSWAVLAVMR